MKHHFILFHYNPLDNTFFLLTWFFQAIKCFLLLLWCCVYSCHRGGCRLVDAETKDNLVCSVFDVGQGLSQICINDTKAVLWDMGSSETFCQWYEQYQRAGMPFIEAIFISHRDWDHSGGLSKLPSHVPFSGKIITSPYEDTATLRRIAAQWSNRISIRTVKQGDTLSFFNGVTMQCLWPPYGPRWKEWIKENTDPNRLSLCCKIIYKSTSCLITSDIDSIAEQKITETYKYSLHSDIMVVPHHGSRVSLNTLFFAYVQPFVGIISCGKGNEYNHPAQEVVTLLQVLLNVNLFDTRFDGPVTARSNGEYWSWE